MRRRKEEIDLFLLQKYFLKKYYFLFQINFLNYFNMIVSVIIFLKNYFKIKNTIKNNY